MALTIESRNVKALATELRTLGYDTDKVFLKLARGNRSRKFIGRTASINEGQSGTMFVSCGIKGVISLGELEPGQMEHLERIHSILPDNSAAPIAIVSLPKGTRPFFPGDRSADGNFGYLMEYVPGAPLSYYHERLSINRDSPSWISNADTFVSMTRQAIGLVNRLNRKGIAHGDFELRNVMVSDGNAVLIDPAIVMLHSDPSVDMKLALQIDNMRKIQLELEIKKIIRDD